MNTVLRVLLRLLMRIALKPALRAFVPVRLQRAALRASKPLTRTTERLEVGPIRLGTVMGDRLAPWGVDPLYTILYFHGGGYCIGSPMTHRPLTSALAAAAHASINVPDYRLAPEHPFPAALEDALVAYRAVMAQTEAVVLAGDSAGGGLALALALALRGTRTRQPDGLLLLSPWVDLACTGASMKRRAWRDPMLGRGGLRRWARLYAGAEVNDPRCSPLHGDLAGLPPVLIQTGTEEVLYDDSVRLRARLAEAGVEVELREYAGLWHDFQMHARVLREADQALAKAGSFVSKQLHRRPKFVVGKSGFAAA